MLITLEARVVLFIGLSDFVHKRILNYVKHVGVISDLDNHVALLSI